MTKSPTLLAAALLLAATTSAPAQDATDALRAAEAAWEDLWNARDAAGLAALYAADGMRVPPSAALATRPDAIETAFRARFEQDIYHMTLTTAEIGHDDGLGWVVGQAKVTALPRSTEIETGTHAFVAIYRQDADGVWRLLFDSRNDAP
jgi:uncharacterized protein (TIGR02246 family)